MKSEFRSEERLPGVFMRMLNREARKHTRKRRAPDLGFSMIELVVAMAMTAVLTVIAILQLQPAMRTARSDSALRIVVDQVRQAREFAVANRRYVAISFAVVGGYSKVTIQQMNSMTPGAGTVNPVIYSVPLPQPMAFLVNGSLPDTPDGFGNAAPIVFGGAAGGPALGMLFQSDGALVDATTLLPINGTVFLAEPNQVSTARAITVLGSTGRVRGWKSNGKGWFQF